MLTSKRRIDIIYTVITWDGFFPIGIYLGFWLWARIAGWSKDTTELVFVLVVPILAALVRAGIGSPVLVEAKRRGVKAWRVRLHRGLFAGGIMSLMILEATTFMFVAAAKVNAIACIGPALGYGLYLLIMVGSCLLVMRDPAWQTFKPDEQFGSTQGPLRGTR